jgi:hypothetical protein
MTNLFMKLRPYIFEVTIKRIHPRRNFKGVQNMGIIPMAAAA